MNHVTSSVFVWVLCLISIIQVDSMFYAATSEDKDTNGLSTSNIMSVSFKTNYVDAFQSEQKIHVVSNLNHV